MPTQQFPESDPRYHTANVKKMLESLAVHAQEDVLKINEPRAQALFETTNAVLRGLMTAYDHYEQGEEPAWRR